MGDYIIYNTRRYRVEWLRPIITNTQSYYTYLFTILYDVFLVVVVLHVQYICVHSWIFNIKTRIIVIIKRLGHFI